VHRDEKRSRKGFVEAYRFIHHLQSEYLAFLAKSLEERICKVELIHSSAI
jgi:hypothetical protein